MLLAALMACDGSSGFRSDRSSYRMTGLMVKNLDRATAQAEVALLADDDPDSTALVTLNSDTLFWSDGLYRLDSQPASSFMAGSYLLTLENDNSLDESVTTNLPGNTILRVASPANRINTGGSAVSVNFLAAQFAEGYAVAAVHRDSAYTGYGYSEWVTSGATAATIPPDAFRPNGSNYPDTGWYYIYVYAYAEAPDSALSHGLLPVPMPNELPDNVDERNFDGHFGSVLVSHRDSVIVPAL
jgi:hypothetical protein